MYPWLQLLVSCDLVPMNPQITQTNKRFVGMVVDLAAELADPAFRHLPAATSTIVRMENSHKFCSCDLFLK